MKKIDLLFLLLLLASNAVAQSITSTHDTYPFKTIEQKQLFYSLLPHFRCLVCQNESLADSNAALARDLRQDIYQQVLHGKTGQQIIDYLVSRYGEFILFTPRLEYKTYLLWFGPV
ncbi:MAG: cytochrome c-type biogenesis protein CcmH, partial [Gammaproteobacteria bacterium]|nr:cytochrome c-type biogenesis protein CcmH [Gammaproteobacteria bacterium]